MKRNELKIGDIIVVETAWLGRPTVHYVLTEVNGEKIFCSFFGDVNCGDTPAGWLGYNDDGLPSGCILVARPKEAYSAFSRDYFGKSFGDWGEPIFDILYKREDCEKYL